MNAPLDAGQRASLEAALSSVTLDDKYTLERGRAYMSGMQALVRLPMLQQERDHAAGLNTAGLHLRLPWLALGRTRPVACGRRKASRRASDRVPAGLERRPRRDRRLGITAGQPVPRARHTTACSRCGTARARASTAAATSSSTPTSPASSRHGGVLVLAGDDHAAKSSTLAHQSDHIFKACDDAGAVSVEGAGISRLRPARLGDESLLRPVGRA